MRITTRSLLICVLSHKLPSSDVAILFFQDAYGVDADGDSPLSQEALKALSFLISGTDGRFVSLWIISRCSQNRHEI